MSESKREREKEKENENERTTGTVRDKREFYFFPSCVVRLEE